MLFSGGFAPTNQIQAYAIQANGQIGSQVGSTQSIGNFAVQGLVVDPNSGLLYVTTPNSPGAIFDFILNSTSLAPSPGSTVQFPSGGNFAAFPSMVHIP